MIQPKIAVKYDEDGDARVKVGAKDSWFIETVHLTHSRYSMRATIWYPQRSHDKRVEKAINRCLKMYYIACESQTKSWEIDLEPKPPEEPKPEPKLEYKLSPCQAYKCPNWAVHGTTRCFIHSPEYPTPLADVMTQHGAAMRRAAQIEVAFRKKQEGKMNDLRRNA